MAMPIDLGKVKKVADKIQGELDTEIYFDVYVDSSANEKFADSMIEYFNNVEDGVVVRYFNTSKILNDEQEACDFAVIVAGANPNCAKIYNELGKFSDKLVLCIDPNFIIEFFNASAYKYDKNEIICPDVSTYIKDENNSAINFSQYTQEMDKSIKYKFENWIYKYSEAAELTYALKFPSLRPKVANSLINTCALENAGIGLIKILPGADMPLMTLNQVRMLLQLAAIYGYEINEDRVIEIVTIVASAFGMRKASSLIKTYTKIPKFLIDGSFGFSATVLLGNIAKEYFASGYAIDGLIEKCKAYFKK